MKRVLIVSPRFVPSNAADMHRVRQALPYLRDAGWEPTVLAVDPAEAETPRDDILLRTIPDDVEVVRTGAVPVRWTRKVGVGSLEARSLAALHREGSRLLNREPFDLVFFSTTALGVSVLGPRWQRRFGVPFAVDLQDPWYSEYYARTGTPPPGGRIKYAASNAIAKRLEPFVLRRAAHVVAVSPAYPEELAERYPWFDARQATVLPFGAPERDFEILREARVANPVFDPGDGLDHWVYVGRAGHDMAFSLGALFAAVADAREASPEAYARLRMHFVGTSYADGDTGTPTVSPVAEAHGVADLVDEQPRRIPYFEALQCLLDATALIVPGSDDPAYTASKVYPYVLAGRPMLAVFHEASTVVDVLRSTEAAKVVCFDENTPLPEAAEAVAGAWLRPRAWTRPPTMRREAFEPYTAREMTARLGAAFDEAVARGRTDTL